MYEIVIHQLLNSEPDVKKFQLLVITYFFPLIYFSLWSRKTTVIDDTILELAHEKIPLKNNFWPDVQQPTKYLGSKPKQLKTKSVS